MYLLKIAYLSVLFMQIHSETFMFGIDPVLQHIDKDQQVEFVCIPNNEDDNVYIMQVIHRNKFLNLVYKSKLTESYIDDYTYKVTYNPIRHTLIPKNSLEDGIIYSYCCISKDKAQRLDIYIE